MKPLLRRIGAVLAAIAAFPVAFLVFALIGKQLGHTDLVGFIGALIVSIAIYRAIFSGPGSVSAPKLRGSKNLSRHVHGIPAHGLAGGDAGFSDANVSAGVKGERATAERLDKLLTRMPELYVLHSLRWPGTTGDADIDHVVYGLDSSGREVIVGIDSKKWKRGDYTWDGVRPTCNGQPSHDLKFATGDMRLGLPSAATSLRRAYPNAIVRTVVAIHGAQSVRTIGSPECDLVPGWKIDEYVASCFAGGTRPVTDSSTLDHLVGELK